MCSQHGNKPDYKYLHVSVILEWDKLEIYSYNYSILKDA